MKKVIQVILCCLILSGTIIAQDPPSSANEFEKQYQQRIKKEYVNGVYIPADLTEAFVELNKLISEESKNKYKSAPEDIAVKKLFFSFGRWISYNWSFYEGSRLSHFIKTKIGISHPDDMTKFIMLTFHRSLNKKPLDAKTLAEQLAQKRRKEWEKSHQVISSEKKKRVEGKN